MAARTERGALLSAAPGGQDPQTMTSRVGTWTRSRPNASESPSAVEIPTRRPEYEPGPTATAMAVSIPRSRLPKRSIASMVGRSWLEWRRPLCHTHSAITCSRYTATLAVAPEESMARMVSMSSTSASLQRTRVRGKRHEGVAQPLRRRLDLDLSLGLPRCPQEDARRIAHEVRRQGAGPFHDADAASAEVLGQSLERCPVHLLDPVEIDVEKGSSPIVFTGDDEGRARDLVGDTQTARQALDERRLPGAKRAIQEQDVASLDGTSQRFTQRARLILASREHRRSLTHLVPSARYPRKCSYPA